MTGFRSQKQVRDGKIGLQKKAMQQIISEKCRTYSKRMPFQKSKPTKSKYFLRCKLIILDLQKNQNVRLSEKTKNWKRWIDFSLKHYYNSNHTASFFKNSEKNCGV